MIQIGFTFAPHPWGGKFTSEREWALVPCARCMADSYAVARERTSLLKALERSPGISCNSSKRWASLSRMTMVAGALRKKGNVSWILLPSKQQLLRRNEPSVGLA